ncbi:hypothetical protein BMW23_0394 [Bodo saltans virus]|uniref:Transmembrane protein n=1 Tax=Bodo saltans virus TaxID=2024608 RepID=A0A2H4UU65_9VIRU|nr:hypothetical protein QJ851_gp0385 [Bodo saltans virus]ATZ80448.1 hypothetical protein BMW23_0394 [Bodo saltans virus]
MYFIKNKMAFTINKYFLIWGYAIIAITVVYIFLLCFIKNNNTDSYEVTQMGKQYLKSITPAYPPPMFNYMDSADVLRKIIPVDRIS